MFAKFFSSPHVCLTRALHAPRNKLMNRIAPVAQAVFVKLLHTSEPINHAGGIERVENTQQQEAVSW